MTDDHPLARAADEQGIKPITDPSALTAAAEGRLDDAEADAFTAAITSCRGGDTVLDADVDDALARVDRLAQLAINIADTGDAVVLASAVRQLRERLAAVVVRVGQEDARLGDAYVSGWYDSLNALRTPGWEEREAGWRKYREDRAAQFDRHVANAAESAKP